MSIMRSRFQERGWGEEDQVQKAEPGPGWPQLGTGLRLDMSAVFDNVGYGG